MAINDKLAVYDGFQAIVEGVDSGRSPALLNRTQLAWAVNATTRGGFLTCRPGWAKLDLRFLDSDGAEDATVKAAFETGGRFQGASAYYADNGAVYAMVSVGGCIFRIDLDSYSVQDLTVGGFTMSAVAPMAWFAQAENYLVIQNGNDRPRIYDGTNIRQSTPRAQGGQEVPTGKQMAYNNGRLWTTRPDGFAFVAGDLAYSDGTRGAVLKFTENEFLNGGGDFMIPFNAGPIAAMSNIAVQDSSTGQGPLQIFTTRGGFSLNAPFDRTQWQNTTSPIQSVSLLAAGATAQNSTVNVNGDIWFRANDGVRSFVVARRDHGTWVNTPLSREVSRALDFDTPEFLGYSSATLFDNRLLFTTQPYMVQEEGVIRGIAHKGLVALDFAPVSQMFNRSQPVWEGVWTGLQILQVLTVEGERSRCLVFAFNSDNKLEVWELSKGDRFDSRDKRITWAFETPDYGFADGGWALKQLAYADIWSDRMAGEVDFTATYRTDSYPFWNPWHVWEECATYKDCSIPECGEPEQMQEQFRARQRLPAPTDACDEVSGKPHRHGYRFAARMVITGFTRIRQFRLIARQLPETAEGGCS